MTTTTTHVWKLAAATTVLGAALSMGCSGTSGSNGRPSASSLHEGLNVLEARADWGMNAAYVKNGTVVYLETRIGPLTPEAMRTLDPATPLHEVDVRYVDEFGNTFSVQRGGDTFIDPAWNVRTNDVPVSSQHREAAFLLAREAGQAAQAQLTPDMAEHIEAAARVGNHVLAEDPELIAEAAKLPTGEATYTSYYQYLKVYSKCIAPLCAAEHSSTWAGEWNGTWDYGFSACNHGACPGASGMNYNCQTAAGARSTPMSWYYTAEGSGSINTVSGGCMTGYAWLTNGSDHNCNDDSWYEDWQVKYGATGDRYGGHGTDRSGYHYACGGGQDQAGDNTHPDCL